MNLKFKKRIIIIRHILHNTVENNFINNVVQDLGKYKRWKKLSTIFLKLWITFQKHKYSNQ